ncbi:hypothetical protein NDU88_006529 [Pleurodeles waltl]|uniref:Uncharacterized protein n=1 Tax=Pleurodeles waltl TaxID=8319 RepID=A0AAV7LQY8_PLEWA|nr:hypothetical protein NDU88_006529 [Pleurodeles waltl]
MKMGGHAALIWLIGSQQAQVHSQLPGEASISGVPAPTDQAHSSAPQMMSLQAPPTSWAVRGRSTLPELGPLLLSPPWRPPPLAPHMSAQRLQRSRRLPLLQSKPPMHRRIHSAEHKAGGAQ